MMLVVSKSKQLRQDRVNVDSMVSFDGIDQYGTIESNPNIRNAVDWNKNWGVSFFFYFNEFTQSGNYTQVIFSHRKRLTSATNTLGYNFGVSHINGQYHVSIFATNGSNRNDGFRMGNVKPNQIYHCILNYDSNSHQPGIYINSVPQAYYSITYDDVNGSWQNDDIYTIGCSKVDALDNFFDGGISHLVVCDRKILQPEARQIHSLGGVIPTSLHSAVVAHYPCTHSEGDVLVDVVDQYSYAKPLSNIYIDYGSNNDGSGEWTKSNGANVNELATYITIGNSATTSKRIYNPSNALSKYRYSANIRTARATGIFEVYQDNTLIAASNGFGDIVNGNLTNNISFDFEVAGSFEIRYRQTDQGAGSSSDLFHDTLQNTEGLSPHHAYLQNFTESEHTGSAQTAWKDFYSKLPVANYGVHFASSTSKWFGTHINNTPLVGNSWSTMIEFTPTNQNSFPNDNYSFRFGFDLLIQFRIRGQLNSQQLVFQWLNNNVKSGNLTGYLPLNNPTKIIITYDVETYTLTAYHGNGVRVFSNVPPISATNGSYDINNTNYSVSAYALLRNVWYNKALSVKEVAYLQSGKELDSAFMDYAFTDFEGLQNRISSSPAWPLSYTGGTGQIIDRELQPPFTKKALQIQATSKAQRILLDSLTESWSGEMHFFLYLDSKPSGAERYLFTSQHNSSQTHFFIEYGNRLYFENTYGPGVIRMQSDVINIQKGWNHFGIRCGSVSNANSFKFYHQGRYVGNNVVTNNYNSIYSDFFPRYISRQYLFTAWASSNNTFPAGTQLDCRLVAFYASRGVFTSNDKEILEAIQQWAISGIGQSAYGFVWGLQECTFFK
ncbi:hypothetical protein OKW21_000648 [Catalinimonas alkaloidigena]|uniref:hypothetical protein n=1 Tax=Catalinimonas alkaloidigena TaxID=1075417 RepID=UPI002404FF5A|nr:hypothetical protein [Catalinimonas alkaloidigena]MDF9795385.1 hypothetical protein [Catalinimonas alkaloidigena]